MGYEKNIKRYREARDMTQQQVADAIGVSRTAVTQWETGWSAPKMGSVKKLAKLFNVKPSDIIAEDDAVVEDGIIDIRDLPEEKRKLIYEFIDFQRNRD